VSGGSHLFGKKENTGRSGELSQAGTRSWAKKWPVISEKKDAPADAESNAEGVPEKLKLLER